MPFFMWKEWFSFSRSQRYGIIVLSLLVLLAAAYPLLYKTLFYNPRPLVEADSFYKIDSFLNSLKYSPPKDKQSFSFESEESPAKSEAENFVFDPNTVTASDLVRLGLSTKQAAVIENYRIKGGRFNEPEDFSKMYVVDNKTFRRLEPFIKIAPKEERSVEPESTGFAMETREMEKLYLELNSVDTLQLTKLRGIGRGYARRIVSYRNVLGGYHSTDQLVEVYGFSKDMLKSIESNLWVDTLKITKLNINIINYQDLKSHPYLTDYQARAIIYYRETMGNFKDIKEVVEHKLIDNNTYERIKPYLIIN
jgi:competence protein ComEA